jgi:hypothetical protein
MIKRKKICFCRDTETQVDILNAKQIWVPIKYSYDSHVKRVLPIDMKMIGYTERSVLHEINPKIAKSWKEIDKGDSDIIIDNVQTSPVDKELDTIQEFFVTKEQLLDAINKNMRQP